MRALSLCLPLLRTTRGKREYTRLLFLFFRAAREKRQRVREFSLSFSPLTQHHRERATLHLRTRRDREVNVFGLGDTHKNRVQREFISGVNCFFDTQHLFATLSHTCNEGEKHDREIIMCTSHLLLLAHTHTTKGENECTSKLFTRHSKRRDWENSVRTFSPTKRVGRLSPRLFSSSLPLTPKNRGACVSLHSPPRQTKLRDLFFGI